jgi:hypothetical protein
VQQEAFTKGFTKQGHVVDGRQLQGDGANQGGTAAIASGGKGEQPPQRGVHGRGRRPLGGSQVPGGG